MIHVLVAHACNVHAGISFKHCVLPIKNIAVINTLYSFHTGILRS